MIRLRCAPAGLALTATWGLAACEAVDVPPLPPAPAIDEAGGAIAGLSLRVRRLVGSTPRECGEFLLAGRTVPDEELDRAVECGLAASAQKQPFWLVLPAPYFHEFHAEGLGDLPVWRGPEPSFSTAPCPRPTAFRKSNGLSIVQCTGDP